jgi:hypothetical protein
MTGPSREAARNWPGLTMVDPDGDPVGRVARIYLDRDSGQPAWALVAAPRRRRGGTVTAPVQAIGGLGRRVATLPRPLSHKRRSKMAGNLKLAAGVAAGYVLGTRAGRERYERLAEMTRQVADRPEVQRMAGRLRGRLGDGLDRAANRLSDRLERARTAQPSSRGPEGAPPEPKVRVPEVPAPEPEVSAELAEPGRAAGARR